MNTFNILTFGKKLTLGTALICMLASAPLTAFAQQDDYKPNRRDNMPTREQVTEIEKMGYTGILPQTSFSFSFFHKDGASEDDINMRMVLPIPIQGCTKIVPFEAEPEIQGKALMIDIEFPFVMLDQSAKDKYACNQIKMAGKDITLSKSELMGREINEIRIRSKFGVLPYKLTVTPDMINMQAKNDPYKRSYEYWFLPQDTVVLSVPMFKGDLIHHNDQLQQLARIARARGLVPIEDEVPEYMPDSKVHNRFFFLDKDGRVLAELADSEGQITLGTLYTTEEYYGPDGKYDKEIDLEITASRPSQTD